MSFVDESITAALSQGLLLTIVLAIFSGGLSLGLGLAVGANRALSNGPRRWLATAHVLIHRHIPALVIMIFWAFAFPSLFVPDVRRALFFDNDFVAWFSALTLIPLPYYLLAALLGLVLNTSAYIAELFRAGLGTIAGQQVEAAATLGASPGQQFWSLLAPQGLAVAWPAITTRLIHNMKNTALASFLTVPEFFHVIQGAINRTFEVTIFFTLAAVVYLGLAACMSFGLDQIGRWLTMSKQTRTRRSVSDQLHRLAEERG